MYAEYEDKTLDLSLVEANYLPLIWVTIGVCSMTQRERVAHRPILAVNRLAHFYHSLMRVDGYCVSGSGYGVGVRCYGMSVCSYGTGVGCYAVRVQSQLGLGGEWLTITERGRIRHTLKT